MEQPAITNFFSKRKRSSALDNNKQNSKVLLLEHQPSGNANPIDTPLNRVEEGESEIGLNHLHKPTQILYNAKKLSRPSPELLCKSARPSPKIGSQKNVPRPKGLPNPYKGLGKDKPRPRTQPDIRETFSNVRKCVRFELKGSLSPKKIKLAEGELTNNVIVPRPPAEAGECSADNPRHAVETTLDEMVTSVSNNEGRHVGPGISLMEKHEIACSVTRPRPMTETVGPIVMDVEDSKAGLDRSLKLNPSDESEPTEDLEKTHIIKNVSLASSLMSRPTSRGSVVLAHVQSASHKKETETQHVSTVNARRDLGLMTPKRMTDTRKEPSLNEIKSRICRSAKLAEMRESLARIDKGNEKLKDIERRKRQWQAESPKLGQFKTISVEVQSPVKDVFASPKKVISPAASPSKAGGYQQRISSGPSELSLPFKHRCLVEVFRCVDTIVSLMHNRKEVVTFAKLRPAVQRMLRRNFGERHLGQIASVYPSAYALRQEKSRSFAHSTKPDRYELTIAPLFDSREGGMDPNRLLARRETFAKNLVCLVMSAHEDFLSKLDPPLAIPRDKLMRWHPGFELDRVPDIEPAALPQPPNVLQHSSARDVLEKARSLFSCNERMERALERVARISSVETSPKPPELAISPVSTALKGIPSSILEKVRANQAARAMVAMSRTPAEERQRVRYSRLPELARIVRNIFVGEKRKVMPLESAVAKLQNSFRERLQPAELEEHVRLLMGSVPGWLEIQNVRNTDFLRLHKNGDMARVMEKLERLATGD